MGARNQRGMSLVEVLIALTVLAIGLTGATAASVYSSRAMARSSHVEEASMLAQSMASAVSSVPYTVLASGVSPFANANAGNDGDIADSEGRYCSASFATAGLGSCLGGATLPAGAWAPDHADADFAGSQFAAMVSPLPTGRTPFQRFLNVAPMPSGNGVMFAVIVRWKEGDVYQRTVVVGTRFQPQ